MFATSYPIYSSGTNATYAFLNQIRKDMATKQRNEAEKRGAGVKY